MHRGSRKSHLFLIPQVKGANRLSSHPAGNVAKNLPLELYSPPAMQASSSNPKGYRFGAFEVDLVAREVRKSGRRVRLQDQPFRVLAMLLESHPNMVARDALRKRLWDADTFVEFDHGVSNAISRIREALGDSAESSRFIETLPKRGYRFMAKIERIDENIAALSRSNEAHSNTVSLPLSDVRRTVAVLPLRLRESVPQDRFLSVALAETIANRIASDANLVVRPTATVMKHAMKDADWARIARALNVELVVEGSIQKLGNSLRILLQVWELGKAGTLHAVKVDGEMCDLFRLQDQLADSVLVALTSRTPKNSAPSAAQVTRHPLAFELYMRAIDQSIFFEKVKLTSAVEMLERAIDLDPGFAEARGLLATVCYHMGAHVDPDPKWLDRAEKAATATLELDPVNCDALCTRGMILFSPLGRYQFRPALRALNAALKINPSRCTARAHRAALLFHCGFHEAACVDFDEGVLANPEFALLYAGRSFVCICDCDYSAADDWNERALALQPSLVHANINSPLPWIYMGELEKAREKLQKARRMIPEEPQIDAMEGMILAREGNHKRAEELADQAAASKRSMLHSHHCWHCAACVYAMCGKPEKAITELKRCAEGGLPNYRSFERDPHFRSLHGHPEFMALMAQLRRDYKIFRDEFNLNETYVPAASSKLR
jgi:eukaryotic-like serine/threonine-protein kinase